MTDLDGIADYDFIEELGAGNHGRYYLADAPARLGLGDARVAVKVLDRRAGESEFRRVANELRIFHSVRSDHLVRIHDAGYADGVLFYAMQHHPDGSLAGVARKDCCQRGRSGRRGAGPDQSGPDRFGDG